jgi:hypothetical protein
MRTILLLLVIIQGIQSDPHVSHSIPIDAEHTLLLLGGMKHDYPAMGEYGANLICLTSGERLTLAISEKGQARWVLGDASVEIGELCARVARVDSRSVVIERRVSDYGIPETSLKVFFDLAGRRVIKSVAFAPSISAQRLDVIENRVCARVKAGDAAFMSCGDETRQTINPQLAPAGMPEWEQHPLSASDRSPLPKPVPQSTYDEFARRRPERVRQGYTRDSASIQEQVGPHQVVADRIWFGKAFYDGEGITGVGGIGYFDTRTNRFTMHSIPELADWSVSALLVESDSVWAGLVRYPEGATQSGGLIRYSFSTRRVIKYEIPDIVLTMLRHNGALFIGTSNGLYVLRDIHLTRFRFEPDLAGQYEPIRAEVR